VGSSNGTRTSQPLASERPGPLEAATATDRAIGADRTGSSATDERPTARVEKAPNARLATTAPGTRLGVDLLALDVRVIDTAALRLASDRSGRPRPFVAAEVGLTGSVGPLEVGPSALLRWPCLATRYQIRAEQDVLVLFRPWRLQPGAVLETAYAW
jgi:hypothetical protein